MSDIADYQSLISDFIKKQMIILGPSIALAKAQKIEVLKVTDSGDVSKIDGDPQAALRLLTNEYMKLSSDVTLATLKSLFEHYPNLQGLGH